MMTLTQRLQIALIIGAPRFRHDVIHVGGARPAPTPGMRGEECGAPLLPRIAVPTLGARWPAMITLPLRSNGM